MPTLLVTGAAGLCGREIVNHFRRLDDWEVIGCGRRSGGRAPFLQHDLTGELPVGPGGFPPNIDAIVHAAAVIEEGATSYGIIDSNLRGAFNVARYAAAAGAKSFINLSSVAVYGSPRCDAIYVETREARPVTLYGLSKLLAESLLSALLPPLPLCHLRLSYVLGRGMKPYVVTNRLHDQLRRDEDVVIDNPDTSRIPFIDTRDIAKACEKAIEHRVEGTCNLNGTPPGSTPPTLREIFEAIREVVPDSRSQIELRDWPANAVQAVYPSELLEQKLPGLDFTGFRESIRFALEQRE